MVMVQDKEEVYWSRKRYRQENKEKIRQKNREYRDKNRERVREWNKIWREKNKERHNECQRICHNGTNRERKEAAIESFGGKCDICGYIYNGKNFAAFDFHHIDPSTKKDKSINFLLVGYLEELKKCQLLCSNCHRVLHQENGGAYHARH